MNDQVMPQVARVALLIDCDNISWQRGAAVVAEAATHGVLGVKRGYGDWGSPHLGGWRDQLTRLAVQPIQQIAYVPGKGATDIALVIDAMDLLYSGQVDTFCLVASDSDYTRLAMRLREAGKRVIGMGGKQTPVSLSNACDRFTFLEVLGNADAVAPETTRSTTPEPSNDRLPVAEHAAESGITASQDTPDLEEMLCSAIENSAEDDGWALLSRVGFHLVASHPTFDSRNYGYARLGLLVRDQDYITVKDDHPALRVRLVRADNTRHRDRARA